MTSLNSHFLSRQTYLIFLTFVIHFFRFMPEVNYCRHFLRLCIFYCHCANSSHSMKMGGSKNQSVSVVMRATHSLLALPDFIRFNYEKPVNIMMRLPSQDNSSLFFLRSKPELFVVCQSDYAVL